MSDTVSHCSNTCVIRCECASFSDRRNWPYAYLYIYKWGFIGDAKIRPERSSANHFPFSFYFLLFFLYLPMSSQSAVPCRVWPCSRVGIYEYISDFGSLLVFCYYCYRTSLFFNFPNPVYLYVICTMDLPMLFLHIFICV